MNPQNNNNLYPFKANGQNKSAFEISFLIRNNTFFMKQLTCFLLIEFGRLFNFPSSVMVSNKCEMFLTNFTQPLFSCEEPYECVRVCECTMHECGHVVSKLKLKKETGDLYNFGPSYSFYKCTVLPQKDSKGDNVPTSILKLS